MPSPSGQRTSSIWSGRYDSSRSELLRDPARLWCGRPSNLWRVPFISKYEQFSSASDDRRLRWFRRAVAPQNTHSRPAAHGICRRRTLHHRSPARAPGLHPGLVLPDASVVTSGLCMRMDPLGAWRRRIREGIVGATPIVGLAKPTRVVHRIDSVLPGITNPPVCSP
jgi:hypothetical protein